MTHHQSPIAIPLELRSFSPTYLHLGCEIEHREIQLTTNHVETFRRNVSTTNGFLCNYPATSAPDMMSLSYGGDYTGATGKRLP
ncbi:MAG: hypothetical protein KME08_04185 [Aphanothece sp. CMT-3BRIN-NPC111]|nr:hypothetical protein [Aphanothece sp. CMT-3BRIN-NPC111]